MSNKKDIVDLLKEKKQIEQQLKFLYSKKELLPPEKAIIEEMEREISLLDSRISKF